MQEANEHPSCNGNEAECQMHTWLVGKDHAEIRSIDGQHLGLDDVDMYIK